MSAEKPGRLAVRQVGKIIQMKIVSLRKKKKKSNLITVRNFHFSLICTI